MVAHLTGSDEGPKSESAYSNWDKKIISVSTNRMTIEFKSDDILKLKDKGFSANILFTPFPNKECESWFNTNKKILNSPNYPLTYYNNMKCSWLITIDYDYYITLDIAELHVRYKICIIIELCLL